MITETPANPRSDRSSANRALLEKRLLRARQAARPGQRPAIAPRASTGEAPLSHGQERLWFLDQLLPEPGLYNLFQAMKVTGPLDPVALQKALDELVCRHEIFRAAVVPGKDGPVQRITHPARLPLVQAEISGDAGGTAGPAPDRTSAAERDERLQRLLTTEARRPFDLARDQLIRALLVRLGPEEHILLLSMHHIVSDGWTLGLLFRELGVLLGAYAAGKDSPLPALPIRFADYAVWERETFQGDFLEKTLGYWRRQLAGAAPLELLTDRPRSNRPAAQGATRSRILPAQLLRDLRLFSQREGTTLFMTLLAGFKAVMHRYTGQDDIVLGSCVAGRPQVELENLAGFFVNTLALRTNAGGQPSFREFLARTRETVLGAMAHQDLPFEKIVAALQPDRTPARNPLFEVMFVLQSAAGAPPQSPGLRFQPLELDNGTAKFDLTFSLTESAEGLVVSAEYRTDLFEAATITRLLGHYQVLLTGAVADPRRRLAELPLLTRDERAQLLDEWSGHRRGATQEVTVVDLFREQVARAPHALALVDPTTRLTYRELDEESNRLARLLQRRGAGPGSLVACCLERTPQVAIALLAILKTGAGYVALDATHPPARLQLMLADCQPVVVITQERLRPQLEAVLALNGIATKPVLLSLETARADIDREPPMAPPAWIEPGFTAYVCYTSGSTGRPKGVCLPHRGVVRLVTGTEWMHFGPEETWLQFAPVAFDASTLEIWGPLLNGGRLAVFPPGLPSVGELIDFIVEQGVTTLFLTTGLFNQVVDGPLERLAGLRQLITGGEAMSTVHAARVRDRLPHVRLVNAYGPTENTTITTAHTVVSVPAGGRSVPIGRPIARTSVYLLDALRQPVPIGVPGELYTGGDGLATGYLGRPDLNADRFVPHPFGVNGGSRLYRTGDLARWLPDGTIEFLGRVDRQIKLRGFRLEPGEIEAVLLRHPDVAQAAVILDRNNGTGDRLVAYVAGRAKSAPEPNAWREHLLKHLPEFMVPAVMVPVPEIPLNANGKVDLTALPPVSSAPAAGRPTVMPPRNPVEARLVAIWEKTLGVSPVGVQDNFFLLGGHSMAGVRLFSRIEEEFGVRLALATLFECPTLEQLASRLRTPEASVPCSSLVALQARGTRPPVFFVHGAGGGNLWTYTNLVPHLGLDQPVYALESRGMRGLPEFTQVEEMATHYLREIRTIQPQGPYYLSGYCFGGNVVFEMARQLDAAGEKIAFLGLLDSAASNSSYQRLPWWRPEFYARFAANTLNWLGDFTRQPVRDQVRYVRRKAGLVASRLTGRLLGRNTPLSVEEVIDTSIFPEIELNLWKTHIAALSSYRPGPYNGRITLFRTRGHPFLCSFDPLFGWGPLARGGVTAVNLPGAHEGIFMEPHVHEVARLFLEQLAQAQRHHASLLPS
ncbi:MAG TPA: amino acid adenylation domain-containing protein [Lacunisphaera sp.]|nr:amino acid adenylation domain-containing protein [Lacunisphaera sp.]